MPSENRAIGIDHPAPEQFAEKCLSALFRARRRKRPRRASVSRQIRNIDAKALSAKPRARYDMIFLFAEIPWKSKTDPCAPPACFTTIVVPAGSPGIDEKRPLAIGRGQGKPESCDAQQDSRNGTNKLRDVIVSRR